ncbi:hypothetical protein BN946_scf184858.g27 [Trametes cinnabarina]|uniref:Uncharacterized protein n=1 Tax=Pycnoporus cinnabarinus TaxID=5643 RepID=A0A060SM35_PYCCI|nr:hypothetical protein BN946_scf184858.g27 [Trametes cinnabarina]
MASRESSIVPPSRRRTRSERRSDSMSVSETDMDQDRTVEDVLMDEDIERIRAESTPSPPRASRQAIQVETGQDEDYSDHHESDDGEEEVEEVDGVEMADPRYNGVPIIMPRSRFVGACNVETVKDVNFLGPRDEFVVSGSDDGNWFMWEKDSGKLHDILEGDGTVVNVIEGHPYLPLVAVSGIDTTVKLFAPTSGPSRFSRLDNAESIIKRNAEAESARSELSNLWLYYRIARQMAENAGPGEGVVQCPVQ